MKFVLTGPKCSGKSSIGKKLAEIFSIPFYETDELIEEIYLKKSGSDLKCRSICAEIGDDRFRDLEREAVESVKELDWCIISTGGSTMLNCDSRRILRENSILILVHSSIKVLHERLERKKIPAFLNNSTAKDLFSERARLMIDLIMPYADIAVDSSDLNEKETVDYLYEQLLIELKIQNFKCSSIGRAIRLTSYDNIKPKQTLEKKDPGSKAMNGVIAKKKLEQQHGVKLIAHTVSIGNIISESCDYKIIGTNDIFCGDTVSAVKMEKEILDAKKNGISVGGIIQLDILGVPAGIGNPIFGSLHSRLGMAIFSIGAIRGVEFGDGSEDLFLDGASSGKYINIKITVKPGFSVYDEQEYNKTGKTDIRIERIHDPCIVPKIIPEVESMAALVILDAIEMKKLINPYFLED